MLGLRINWIGLSCSPGVLPLKKFTPIKEDNLVTLSKFNYGKQKNIQFTCNKKAHYGKFTNLKSSKLSSEKHLVLSLKGSLLSGILEKIIHVLLFEYKISNSMRVFTLIRLYMNAYSGAKFR